MSAEELVEQLKIETEGGAPTTEQPEETIKEVNNFDAPVEESEQPKGEDPAVVTETLKKSATRYVKIFNSILKLIFKPLYKKTILEPDDIQKMREYRSKHAGQTN